MADNRFGDPASVSTVATTTATAADSLQKLTVSVQTDVRDWVRQRWSGWAADAMIEYWENLDRAIIGTGSPIDAYSRRLDKAAATMRLARRALAAAQQYQQANGLAIVDGPRMVSVDGRPDGPARAAAGQRLLDAAVALNDNAQQQIAAANRILVASVSENIGSLLDSIGGIEAPRLRSRADRSQDHHGAGGRPRPTEESPQTARNRAAIEKLTPRIDDVGDADLRARLDAVDPTSPDAAGELARLNAETRTAEIFPDLHDRRLDPQDSGVSVRTDPDPEQPESTRRGNFVHEFAEPMRHAFDPGPNGIPQQFDDKVASGTILPLRELPDGLRTEVKINEFSKVDRIDVHNGVIYEIKSNHPDEILAGLKRSDEYVELANQKKFLGRDDWTGRVVVYDKDKAAGFDSLLHDD